MRIESLSDLNSLQVSFHETYQDHVISDEVFRDILDINDVINLDNLPGHLERLHQENSDQHDKIGCLSDCLVEMMAGIIDAVKDGKRLSKRLLKDSLERNFDAMADFLENEELKSHGARMKTNFIDWLNKK